MHGESGTGKSTAVSIIAKRFGFEAVATYADQSRTPARLEGVVREAGVHGSRGVVVLDDFEIFLSETTSLRVLSKLLRQLLGTGGQGQGHGNINNSSRRCLFIIISNSKHKLFGALQDISTIVRFETTAADGNLQDIQSRGVKGQGPLVRAPDGIVPFVSVEFGDHHAGNSAATALVRRLPDDRFCSQTPTQETKRRSATPSVGTIQNNRDCISYLWSDIYTDKILDHYGRRQVSTRPRDRQARWI